MLNYLHDKINNIVSIHGLSENTDGSITVHYKDITISGEQQNQINLLINNWPLDKAKLLKINDLDNWWSNQLNIGWITPHGWKLGLSINDVSLLTGLFTLAKEANNLGFNDPVSIIDNDAVSHSISFSDLTALMMGYGQARSNLSNIYSNKKTDINNASSIQEINNIEI